MESKNPTLVSHPPAGDIAYGSFYSGAVGGAVVAFVFLAADVMAGRPLFTPSLLGSVVFLGQSAADVTGVNLVAVALFTGVHFVAFGCLGVLSTMLFRAALERDMAPTVVTGAALFVAMQGGLYL
ncbi:MAG TPA: hypothetical protein VJ997_02860, partial [Longimicrobiales bacterium]|nr:hypothetical protein [Longimicrobiales bacterium]